MTNNNIMTLWKIARKQLALEKWHPSCQVSTSQYLHFHTRCSPRPVPVSVSNHALPRLSIVINWGQTKDVDRTPVSRTNQNIGTVALARSYWGNGSIADNPIFPCGFACLGIHGLYYWVEYACTRDSSVLVYIPDPIKWLFWAYDDDGWILNARLGLFWGARIGHE